MLVAELIKDASKPFGHGISLDKLAFPIFPDVVKKMIVSHALKIIFHFELAYAVQNDTF